MRIAVVASNFPVSFQKHRGHSVFQTVRRLAEMAEVEAFCPLPRYPGLIGRVAGTGQKADPMFQPEGVRPHYLSYPAVPVVSRRLNGDLVAMSLMEPLKRFAPDVVLAYFVYPDGYGALQAGRKLNVPVIIKAMGSDVHTITPEQRRKTCAALSGADHILTVSHALRQTAIELGAKPEHTRAILNGCDGSIFRVADKEEARATLGIDAGDKLILYVGRLDMRKGLRELVEATVALHASLPNVKTALLGEGEAGAELKALVRKNNAAEYVLFVPPVPTKGVAQWMAAADLVTLPSYAEGCPNTVIEALASGRPVVASNVGGIPELMDSSCGEMVPPRQSEALRQALESTLGREWDAEQIAKHHRRTWEQVAEETLAVLEEVVRERKGSSAGLARTHA